MKVVFTGGGTGGHIYPAVAIADALGANADSTFIGTADRLESTLVPQAGYRLFTVSSRPLSRKLSPQLLVTAFSNFAGTLQSLRLLARLKPDIVIATGGYVCFPVVLAARMLRNAGVLHASIALLEPNAHPGMTNRLLAPFVDEVWGAFPEADRRFAGKYVHTGVPVRANLRALPSRDEAIARLGLSANRRTLLAMGGSQGARSINDALTVLVKSGGLPTGWQLIHITGERDYDRVRTQLNGNGGEALRPYLNDLSDAYAAADLVLSRGGASTLGEIAAIGKPAVLVPYPYAAENHQALNAKVLGDAGAAIVVTDDELTAGHLPGILAEATAPVRLASMRAQAESLRVNDPIALITARIAALTQRKNAA